MKEVIGKRRGNDPFPKKLIIVKVEITNMKTTAETFNNFFVTFGPTLTSKITESNPKFEAYISKVNTELHENPLTKDEFSETIKSLKICKASSFDKYVSRF